MRAISIPYGAIKSIANIRIIRGFRSISIPYGAIKSIIVKMKME